VGLERAGQPAAARIAYEAALTAWPEDLTTLMGLGNVSYKLGKRGDAARFFTEAVRAHPQSGDAHNNLAQLLLEQGRLLQATEAVNRAISLGGPNLAIYRATRAAIRAAERNTQEAMLRVRSDSVFSAGMISAAMFTALQPLHSLFPRKSRVFHRVGAFL
jgi:tetratricopeptide (TPR) repeat protein